MTWETLGGSGVGPAVMRYCLMNGFGVMGAARLAAVALALELALERLLEVRRRHAVGPQRDPDDARDDREADPDPRDDDRSARLALAARAARVDGVLEPRPEQQRERRHHE